MNYRARIGILALALAAAGGCSILPQLAKSPTTTASGSAKAVPLADYSGSDPAVLRLKSLYRTMALSLQDIVIPPGATWTSQQAVNAGRTLDIHAARLDYPIVAGSQWPMQVAVDGSPITSPLLNKAPTFQYADGRVFPYYSVQAESWCLFFSPDFNLNNTPQAGGYQVVTDPGQAYHYVWDVSSIVRAATSMAVKITNLQSYDYGHDVIVEMPPAFALSVAPGYFSPRVGGTATASITTDVPWDLSVKGFGPLAAGTSSTSVVWNGAIGGTQLPDGIYTLELSPASDSLGLVPQDATVGIDTTPPVVDSADVTGIDEADDQSLTYTVTVKAHDPVAGGVSSGLETASTSVHFTNAAFDQASATTPSAGTITVTSHLATESTPVRVLRYQVTVADRARNVSARFDGAFSARQEVHSELVAITSPTQVAAAPAMSVQALGPSRRLSEGDVFYDRCGLVAEAHLTYLVISDRPLAGRTPAFIENTKTQDRFIYKDVDWVSGFESPLDIAWNGLHVNPLGGPPEYAPEGLYRAAFSRLPGFVVIKPGTLDFKVSDLGCVRRDMWETAAPAPQTDKGAAHTLQKHIVLPGGATSTSKLDYFGAIGNDPSLAIVNTTGQVYDEARAKYDGPFPLTELFMQNPVYGEIMQMANVVSQIGQPAPLNQPKSNGKEAPVVLPNGRVRWVLILRNTILGIPLGSIFNAFPAWRDQEKYEAQIR